MLARDENAFGVYDNHRSFDFPMVEVPKEENPKQKGGSFRGGRYPEPVRSVPIRQAFTVSNIPLRDFSAVVYEFTVSTLVAVLNSARTRHKVAPMRDIFDNADRFEPNLTKGETKTAVPGEPNVAIIEKIAGYMLCPHVQPACTPR